jgi:ATP/maltotriose-dependent transcriptional regulator MalT
VAKDRAAPEVTKTAGAARARPVSEREAEVLLLVARGLSNRQIAQKLYLAESTVKRHLANVYPKLGVRSRGQATREALQRGLISAEDLTGARGADRPSRVA